jgi:hypothetical protein
VLHLSLALLLAAVAPVIAQSNKHRRDTSDYTIGPSIQPMIIYGERWSQQLTIINVDYYQGGESTVGVLRFYTSAGQAWRLPLKRLGPTEAIPINLKPGEMLMLETEVSEQPQQLGWARLELGSNTDERGIYHAYTTFRKQTPGLPDLMTSVPMVDDLEDEWIVPFDNTEGKYPGIGLVNTGTSSTTFSLEVFDLAGSSKKVISKTVAARNLLWFALLAENPELAGMAGQIKITGGLYWSALFTLQFAPTGAFTALPVVHTFGRR